MIVLAVYNWPTSTLNSNTMRLLIVIVTLYRLPLGRWTVAFSTAGLPMKYVVVPVRG